MQDDTFQAILALGDTVLVSNGKDHRKCKILRWKRRSVQCNELDALIIHPPQKVMLCVIHLSVVTLLRYQP